MLSIKNSQITTYNAIPRSNLKSDEARLNKKEIAQHIFKMEHADQIQLLSKLIAIKYYRQTGCLKNNVQDEVKQEAYWDQIANADFLSSDIKLDDLKAFIKNDGYLVQRKITSELKELLTDLSDADRQKIVQALVHAGENSEKMRDFLADAVGGNWGTGTDVNDEYQPLLTERSRNDDLESSPNSELTYEQRAKKYETQLKALKPEIQAGLKIFLIKTMEQAHIVSSDKLKHGQFSEALSHLHSIANESEKALLNKAGFETTSCFNSGKAAAKIKALMGCFYGDSTIRIKNEHQYEIYCAMPGRPETTNSELISRLQTQAQQKSPVGKKSIQSDVRLCLEAGCEQTLAWVMAKNGLKQLDLSNCSITFDHKKIRTLFLALAVCPLVTTLNLSNSNSEPSNKNKFEDFGCMLVFNTNLGANRTLRCLNISEVKLEGVEITSFGRQVSALERFAGAVNRSKLTSVSLGRKQMKVTGQEILNIASIIEQNKRLTTWDVHSADLKPLALNFDMECRANHSQIRGGVERTQNPHSSTTVFSDRNQDE